jgi:hypothetical protein
LSAVQRIVTWLLVGAVAALAVAAGVDALRGEGEGEPGHAAAEPARQTGAEAGFAQARRELRAAGVSGVLTYADEACRLSTISLPELERRTGIGRGSCTFRSTVGNEFVLDGSTPEWPGGGLSARCNRPWLELRLPDGSLYARARGCGVAWRPDGSATFLRNGEVLSFAPCRGDELGELPVRCTWTVLSRADLAEQVRRARWTGFDFAVQELHWLDQRRFAAIVQARSADRSADLLAIFDEGTLVSGPRFGYNELSNLRPSPSGAFVTARILNPSGLVAVDRDGGYVRLALGTGDALAWSPDEEWIAEATADGIYVYPAEEPNPRFIHIPIVARDLVWR